MIKIEVKRGEIDAVITISSDITPYKEERFILKKAELRELQNKINRVLEDW